MRQLDFGGTARSRSKPPWVAPGHGWHVFALTRIAAIWLDLVGRDFVMRTASGWAMSAPSPSSKPTYGMSTSRVDRINLDQRVYQFTCVMYNFMMECFMGLPFDPADIVAGSCDSCSWSRPSLRQSILYCFDVMRLYVLFQATTTCLCPMMRLCFCLLNQMNWLLNTHFFLFERTWLWYFIGLSLWRCSFS